MRSTATVTIHESQFPDQVSEDLVRSLVSRQMNHKFHYESVKQSQKWLALHEAYSPARTDPDCLETYAAAFEAAASAVRAPGVLIGLGCGGGQKDAQLLGLLGDSAKPKAYIACDVSAPLTLVARKRVLETAPDLRVCPLVCDLLRSPDLPEVLRGLAAAPDSPRLITFFGMIPNFEPATILPILRRILEQGDLLLFGANLAPGPDYAAGVRAVLPLYDNELTRDWLLTVLLDLGVEKEDGELLFSVEPCPQGSGASRIEANYRFAQARAVRLYGRTILFQAGDVMRLFFSYRYTPDMVESLLEARGISVLGRWITRSEEEGLFLCRASDFKAA